MAPKSVKNNLNIRLSESVVFLRGSVETTVTGRRTTREAQPAMLRGLLTLTLAKPTKISSIEIRLEGKSRTAWPEGVGARRLEVTEEHEIFSASTVFFRAGKPCTSRRPASVGPGLVLDRDEDGEDADESARNSNEALHGLGYDTGATLPSHPPRRVVGDAGMSRRVSMDHHYLHLQSNALTHTPLSLDDVPTPPYTPSAQGIPLPAPGPLADGRGPVAPTPTMRRGDSWMSGGSIPEGHAVSVRPTLSPRDSQTTLMSDVDVPIMRENSESHSSSSSRQDLTLSRRPSDTSNPSALSRSPSRGRAHLPNGYRAPSSGTPSRTPSVARAPTSPLFTPASPSSSPSQPRLGPTQRGASVASHHADSERDRGRRTHARFSLSAVSNALLDAVKERVRSSSPLHSRGGNGKERAGTATPPAGSRDRSPSGSRDRVRDRARERSVAAGAGTDREAQRGRARERELELESEKGKEKERSTLGRISGALGLDNDDAADGWKEFRKGTYTYPVSFAIPVTVPPTLSCDYGSVAYRLKATVHRPGAFTQRLTAVRDVTLIACPGEDDLEESDNIVVQREWDAQMHYMIIISGRTFPIGSAIPLQVTFMPIAKVKVFRISAVLEERVDYYTQFKRVARTDGMKRFELMSVRYTDKESLPLLPLTSDYASSPLRGLIDASDESEAASSLMGPGPWAIQHEMQLPKSCARMHFTNKHKRSNIGIIHQLKIIFRVERGDDAFVDAKTGKRKQFDIVVQTPIHILSCRCNSEWTALPRYSSFATETHAKTQSCPCSSKRPGSTVSVDQLDPQLFSASHPLSTAPNMTMTNSPVHLHTFEPNLDFGSAESPDPPTTNTSVGGQYTDGLNLSRVPSDAPSEIESLYRRNTQFARLVAGQESELGEAPPTYEYVASHQNEAGAFANAVVVLAHR